MFLMFLMWLIILIRVSLEKGEGRSRIGGSVWGG